MMTILQQRWDCTDYLDLVFMFVSSCCPCCISTAPLLLLRTPDKSNPTTIDGVPPSNFDHDQLASISP